MNSDSVVGACYFCHMAIHKRFQNISTWRKWANLVSRGWSPPTGRDYRDFAVTWSIVGKEATLGAESFKGIKLGSPLEFFPQGKNFANILPEVEPDYYTGRKLGDPLIFDSLEGYKYAATTI
jgi:hypothetical protein